MTLQPSESAARPTTTHHQGDFATSRSPAPHVVAAAAALVAPPNFAGIKTLAISPGKKAEPVELERKELAKDGTSGAEEKKFTWTSAPTLPHVEITNLLPVVPGLKDKEHAFRALDEVGKVEIRGGLLCVSSLIPVPPKKGEWKISFEPLTVVLGKEMVFSMGNGAEEALETFRQELRSNDHEEVAKMSPACLFAGLLERYMKHGGALIEDLKGKLASQDEALKTHGKLDKEFLLEASSLRYDLEKMEAITRSYSRVADRLKTWCEGNQVLDSHAEEAISRLKGRTEDLIGQLDRREQKIEGLLSTNAQMSEDRKGEVGRQIGIIGVPLVLAQTGLSYFQVYDFINGHPDVARLGLSAVMTACLVLYLYARGRKIL